MKNLLKTLIVATLFLFACNISPQKVSEKEILEPYTFEVVQNKKYKNPSYKMIMMVDNINKDTIFIDDTKVLKLAFSNGKLTFDTINKNTFEDPLYKLVNMSDGFISVNDTIMATVKIKNGDIVSYAIYGEANLRDNAGFNINKTLNLTDDLKKAPINDATLILGDSSILDNTTIEINTDLGLMLEDSSILDNTLSNYSNEELNAILGDSSILDNTVMEIAETINSQLEESERIDTIILSELIIEAIILKVSEYKHFASNLKYPVYISVNYVIEGDNVTSEFQFNYDFNNYIKDNNIGDSNNLYRSKTKFTNILE